VELFILLALFCFFVIFFIAFTSKVKFYDQEKIKEQGEKLLYIISKQEGTIPFEFTSKQMYDEEAWRNLLTEEELEIRKQYVESEKWRQMALESGLITENKYLNKTDELIKLKSLLDSGALTSNEFKEAKRELLETNTNQKQILSNSPNSIGPSCSQCGGTNFKRVRSTGGKLAGGILAPKSRAECQTCGYKNQF